MPEQNLLKMFQGILSSQSFELLSHFSDEAMWSTLQQEEKEALAQLFLIHGEKTIHASSFKGDLTKAKAAFDSACRLMPQSAKTWFRYGSYLALSENREDVNQAIVALEKSIELDNRFFDAHYALGSVQLRLGAMKNEEESLLKAEKAFSLGHKLMEEGQALALPIEFFWHRGLVHFLLGRISGEPRDFKQALIFYQRAFESGLSRSDFFNDFANGLVEFSLLVGSLESIKKAASFYEEALLSSQREKGSCKDQAVFLFNAGCCYVQLFENSMDKRYFQEAEAAFLRSSTVYPLDTLYQKQGQLYFLAARCWLQKSHIEKAIDSFQKAHVLGLDTPVMLAYYAQALLMLYEEDPKPYLLQDAEGLVQLAESQAVTESSSSTEPSLARALCLLEKGRYFSEVSLMKEAESAIQKILSLHPKCAHAWQALGTIKMALAQIEKHEDYLKEAVVSFLLASKSIVSQYSHFWNSWGISLLSLAELTGEPLLAEDACSKFEVAIELSSHSEPDWIYNFACAIDLLGALREEVALHEQAIELFTYVSEEDPTFYDVLVQQGISYMRLGDARESLAEYRKGAELFRRYLAEEKEDEYVWLELGICLLRQAALLPQEADEKSLSLAKNAFLNALSLGNSLAYYHLACLYAFQKNYSEAMEFLWKAEAENALPPLQDLLEEEALAPLVATRPFLQFLRDIVFTESDATPEEGEESLPQ